MEPRDNKIFLTVGDRGTGKTDLLKSLIKCSIQPKQLVVDTFDNPVWRNMKTWDNPNGINEIIPVMPFDKLAHHKKGLYRFFVQDDDVLQDAIENHCMNTMLIVEDASRYFGTRLTKAQRKYLLNSKQKNLDIHLIFHYLADIPPGLVRMANYITLFKTHEFGYDKKRYFQPGFHQMFNEIAKSKDKHINYSLQLK